MRRGLAETIEHLKRARTAQGNHGRSGRDFLEVVNGFGENPGRLAMRAYVPPSLVANAPLVVVLHGCTQSAETYARGAGWIEAADRYGFALLCPEQGQSNNPNLCFNWFVPEDIRRGSGEAASIAQMIGHITSAYGLDREQVFITGLSAGGAMANVMLASYPELFRAGVIIAGLPYASAKSVQEAFAAMSHQRDASDPVLGARVKAASPGFAGPWPTVSVWHGDRDMTVSPAAGEAIARQWANVHDARPDPLESAPHHRHRTWTNANGAIVVEHRSIPGMGHGTPLETEMAGAVGTPGSYLLDVGISSTLESLKGWGLSPIEGDLRTPSNRQRAPAASLNTNPPPSFRSSSIDVGAVINNALRAAGLLK